MYGQGFTFSGVTFFAASAPLGMENGLSLEGGNGVLGQGLGVFPALPARFLDERVVPQNGFRIRFIDESDATQLTGVTLNGSIWPPLAGFGGGGIGVTVNTAVNPGAGAAIQLADVNDLTAFTLLAYLNGALMLQRASANVISMDATNIVKIGEDSTVLIDAIFNSGGVIGKLGYKYGSVDASISANPLALLNSQSNGLMTDEGAGTVMEYTLPAVSEPGIAFSFACVSTDGVRVTATNNNKIFLGTSWTVANGYIESINQGSFVRIVSVPSVTGGDAWIAETFTGGWTIN